MSLINVTNLSFSYNTHADMVFENVSFQLDTNWKLGLIGRNGRGKTTFLHLLQGKYDYSGTIHTSVSFDYFPYEVPDATRDTVDVLHQIAPDCMDWELYRELSLLEVPEETLYRPFSTLSQGEQTKVLLAALFLKQHHFLLIDEPTNHLDEQARVTVGNYLRRKKGFILVSHDRTLLDTCVDHILSINRTGIDVQKGNFSSWWDNKQQRDRFEQNQHEKLQKDIGRLQTAAKRSAAWSDKVESSKYGAKNSGLRVDRGYVGHKSAKMMKRAKAIETRQQTAIEEKSRLLRDIEKDGPLSVTPLRHHCNRLAELKSISLFYGHQVVCQDVSFSIQQGERIALCGKNGCGKSSILKWLYGEEIAYTGTGYRASGLQVSYVPQSTAHMAGTLSEYARRLAIEERVFVSILCRMGLEPSLLDKDISHFSEGQKKKVLLAGSLCEKAHVYVWDEPLNFVDVISRMQIEELILTCQPTMLFVEHDAAFRQRIATRQIMLE